MSPLIKRYNYFLYAIATIAVLYAVVISRHPEYAPKIPICHIGYVYDGDTVELICGGIATSARLIGFDTPETRDASCPSELALGKKATERLREIVRSGKVQISREGYDKYGRILARIWVDGEDVGQTLINENLARRYFGGSRIHWCSIL